MTTLLFLGTEEDVPYAARLKVMAGSATVYTKFHPVSTITEVVHYCKSKHITGCFTTNRVLLQKLLATQGTVSSKLPSMDSYAGSYICYQGIEFVFIHELKQLITVPYMPMLTRRFISKLVSPSSWSQESAFKWELITPSNYEAVEFELSFCDAIACDIETIRNPLSIQCIGYTGITFQDKEIRTSSYVLPLDSMYAVSMMRSLNWNTPAPKIFQNGKYDLSYLSRYNAVPFNYLWDTANLMHCWYSELPKDLGFLGAFFIRKAMYWKDLAHSEDKYEFYKYNALDTWTTALVWMQQMLELPDWARRNYLQEFPLVFPAHMCEMTGIKRDMQELQAAREVVDTAIQADTASLSKMVGVHPAEFNVNSAPQNKALRTILGCGDLASSDETHLKKIASRHPINARIANKILDIRGNRKLASTYLRVDSDKKKDSDDEGGAKEFKGRILYALNPHGTDTGRLASREHHFWCGLQIQNIPRGKEVKRTLIADEGFRLAEVDLEQAETRDTAYISGDKNLIAAVESDRDFHSSNAEKFFGVPYEQIYDQELKKTLDKSLRDLAKRVNHGANYLMGAYMLLDTMGEDNVWRAKRILNLPRYMGAVDVCQYLLDRFHKTYPSLESKFYNGVVHEVMTTSMIVSKTYHHTGTKKDLENVNELAGWTRYCFGNPKKNKLDKNALVAHVPQNLNAMTLNKAFMKVFYEIAMNSEYRQHFKLCAQIHDSILFQFRIGHEYLCDMVKERMEIPVTILGYDEVVRTFTVPAAVKAGKDGLGAIRWSETE